MGVALTCHYRVGWYFELSCRFINNFLGIFPAGAGTQRLPGVIGSMITSDMICTVKYACSTQTSVWHLNIIIEIDNKQVKRGILSEQYLLKFHFILSEQSILRSESIKVPKKIANEPSANRIIVTKKVEPYDDFFYDQLREQLNKRGVVGHIAPELCIQAIKAAASKSFEDGIKRKRELLMEIKVKHYNIVFC